MLDPSRRPQVVIVGAGFGGLQAAKALANAPVDIALVDTYNHHCFQPLLYQVATAALSPADVAWPIRAIVRTQKNVRVIMARVTGVDVQARRVHTSEIDLPYDYLVLATGSTHSYFGHDDWAPFAPGLKHIADATEIRRRFLLAFERAEVVEDEAERARLLTFVVVGGGATGVEMAGAIAEVARRTLRHDFRRIDPRTSRTILLEAGPRLLPSFPKHLSDYAMRSLQKMGVEVELNRTVTGCDAHGVSLGGDGGNRIEAATVVWAAGVVASAAALWIGAEHDRAGRVKVNADLTVSGRPEIFAVGDTASVLDRDGRPVPGIAPAAKQMGSYAGKAIAARVLGQPAPAPFAYRHLGELATIGRKSAVVKLGFFQLTGFLGWLFWSAIHIYFLIGLRNRFVVAINWLWSYVTFQRGARLIGVARQ
ncbi:MAG: NAD(P)/FAD-dependent oxidoreductase [Hyphomicrobiales bacterium]|nr:NAD(P)/FAD-dependent oxidoreductase [Hyphomicrobiales bacterium]MDE2283444.1 NAD(P)/FAD-dependent oxidoreductase [Hyphomicrobiales bacterium]